MNCYVFVLNHIQALVFVNYLSLLNSKHLVTVKIFLKKFKVPWKEKMWGLVRGGIKIVPMVSGVSHWGDRHPLL